MPEKRFERSVVYLAELERGRMPLILDGYSFVDCEIVGPAVILPMDGFAMVNCDLGGTAIGLLWEIPLQRTEIIGAIGLRNSSFEACRFRGVGFAGHPEGIWRIIAGTTRSD